MKRTHDIMLYPEFFSAYTDREVFVRVTYKLPGGKCGIDPNWCVLGFQKGDIE